jgi:hypothetical protein
MRTLLVLAILSAVGCGGDGLDASKPVAQLSPEQQEALCDDFVATICADPEFADFCTPCATTIACADAVAANDVGSECGTAPQGGPITVGMVESCADTADFEECVEGGGCMFDAVEAQCQ